MDIIEFYNNLNEMPRQNRADRNEFIKVIESNMDLVEACCIDNESYEYPYAVRIVFDYADCLFRQSSYKKALPYLDRAVSLCQNSLGFNAKNTDIGYYERLIGIRAITYYYRKKIELAKQEFEWLVENYPENDSNRAWLGKVKVKSMEQTTTLLIVILLALAIAGHFLSRRYIVLQNCFFILGNCCLIAFVIISIMIWLKRRKIGNS